MVLIFEGEERNPHLEDVRDLLNKKAQREWRLLNPLRLLEEAQSMMGGDIKPPEVFYEETGNLRTREVAVTASGVMQDLRLPVEDSAHIPLVRIVMSVGNDPGTSYSVAIQHKVRVADGAYAWKSANSDSSTSEEIAYLSPVNYQSADRNIAREKLREKLLLALGLRARNGLPSADVNSFRRRAIG